MKNRQPSSAAHVIVLAGPLVALIFTLCVLASGYSARFLPGAWFCAAIWSFLTALAGALWRGIRHGDWSAFSAYTLPERDDDHFDWETRTGRYSWPRDDEENELHAHDDYPVHGPIA